VAIIFSGPMVYDDAHKLALRAMTMVLESRLFDSIRQELGGTYSIDATPSMQKLPRPEYTVRIEWTCDPAKTAALVQRVFEEIDFVRNIEYSSGQVARIREAMLREFERNSQDNRYLLNQVARKYEEGEAADVAAAVNLPERIAALTGDQIRAGGEDLPEHAELREGHAGAREEVAGTLRC
jgi:predicted Zn-dependent peptidase